MGSQSRSNYISPSSCLVWAAGNLLDTDIQSRICRIRWLLIFNDIVQRYNVVATSLLLNIHESLYTFRCLKFTRYRL